MILEYRLFLGAIIISFLISCSTEVENTTLFESVSAEASGIGFSNILVHTNEFNVYKYRNFYNGAGVALGDINNDGLIDVYLTSNQNSNRLYVNEGDFRFRDITEASKVGGNKAWSTGVSMVDINGDGLLDIYVCNSGDVKGDDKENELFINNGDLTFTESAAAYNLNDNGFSTHASFFDYDKDGDLDVYILNNSYQAIGSFNLRKNERPNRDVLGGDKLMENWDGIFVDVSEEAGIYGSVIGFGLGVTIGDVNNDNWEDIFVSNDFFERDYLYINQRDGTFKEDLTSQMKSISGASMGADLADIDNDGRGDIFVTEMLPSDYQRLKTVTTFEDWNKYQYSVKNGYHHQFTRNMLHHNIGGDKFSEIGRLSGVDASDWSWGALFFDMDNDGLKDLYIANGIYRDLTNQDYLAYVANEEVMMSMIQDSGVNYDQLIDIIPSNMVPNHSYHNKGKLEFEKYKESGLNEPSFSNGAAYGDLDNDGDLDLVVNNINMPLFVYRNQSDSSSSRYLKIELLGLGKNTLAHGSSIRVISKDEVFTYEVQPARGFQSSMDPRPNVGVGSARVVDVEITWPDLSVSRYNDIRTNTTLTAKQVDAKESKIEDVSLDPLFTRLELEGFKHDENAFVDFNQERLVYHMHSNRGPIVGMGDLNRDGNTDVVVPGAKGFSSSVLLDVLSNKENKVVVNTELKKLKEAEHTRALSFDADNDGDLDVYLASGGVDQTKYSEHYFDALMLNDGSGNLFKTSQRLPNDTNNISTGAVASGDIDGDGDVDLIVGERIKVGQYGAACSGYMLLNDGTANFEDKTSELCPGLEGIGMITDASFEDLDGDGDLDLIVVGEYMGIELLENTNGIFQRKTGGKLDTYKGWWNVLHTVDIDQDGDQDLIVGNHGLNSRFKATVERPIKLYFNDYDQNGFSEGIQTFEATDGRDYPFALRHNLLDQLKGLKRKFPNFESFKNAAMEDIFPKEILDETRILEANEMRTMLFINEGNFSFRESPLPIEVQVSPVYAIASHDFDQDGDIDIVMGGNLFNVQPEVGIYDASYGTYLENQGNGKFKFYADGRGFIVEGEVRDIKVVENEILVMRNNERIETFRFK